jgi:hypothetical protein
MLDVHQLNVFLAAAESLSFTQAAQQLHMTQPSVSQHIQALERHFDMQLFPAQWAQSRTYGCRYGASPPRQGSRDIYRSGSMKPWNH